MLIILAHRTKNLVKIEFRRFDHTISQHFTEVLNAMIRLKPLLLVTPEPVPTDSTDYRWKPFVGCLGAIDGTYIKVEVRRKDRARYRNRKAEITVEVLCLT